MFLLKYNPKTISKSLKRRKKLSIKRVNRSAERLQKLCRNYFNLYDAKQLQSQQYDFK